MYSLEGQEFKEEEGFLLHWQTAARAEVHWEEATMDGEEPEEELEMIEGEGDWDWVVT